jgi:hypothetical protein
MKYCWKMKWSQRARLGSHGKEVTLVRGEATPEREKGGDIVNWADAILTGLKNKENSRNRFIYYKWTVKI